MDGPRDRTEVVGRIVTAVLFALFECAAIALAVFAAGRCASEFRGVVWLAVWLGSFAASAAALAVAAWLAAILAGIAVGFVAAAIQSLFSRP